MAAYVPEEVKTNDLAIGTRVRVVGLQKSVDLNGREGSIINKQPNGRYVVEFDDEDEFDVTATKKINRGNLEVITCPSTTPPAASPPQIVRVHGLNRRADLNGYDGLLCGPPLESGRFRVKMVHTQEEVSIHPDNFYRRMQWESDTDWESRMRIRARFDEYERRRNEPKLEDVGGGESKAEASADAPFYYHVLNITKEASEKDIKKAFRELSRKLHPDKGGDREQFEVVKKAYDILSHEKLRRVYDQEGQDGVDFMMEQMRDADIRRTKREQKQADAEAEAKRAEAEAKRAQAQAAKTEAEAERARAQEETRTRERIKRAEAEAESARADAVRRSKEEARAEKARRIFEKQEKARKDAIRKEANEKARRAKEEIEKLKADARKREEEAQRQGGESKTSQNEPELVMSEEEKKIIDEALEDMRNGMILLCLNDNKITDAGAIKLAEMLPSSKLTNLWLGSNQITDAGAIKLAEMLPSSKLTQLWLNNNQITDAGAIKLAEMLPSSKLTELNLWSSQITDAGAIKLAEMLPSSKLTVLDLSANSISDAGAIKLAEMLPSSKLTILWLNHNQITDAGAIKLAEMLPSSELTRLDLDHNQITDAGAIKLAEMLPSSKLTALGFRDNSISDAGKAALKDIKNKDGEKIRIRI